MDCPRPETKTRMIELLVNVANVTGQQVILKHLGELMPLEASQHVLDSFWEEQCTNEQKEQILVKYVMKRLDR